MADYKSYLIEDLWLEINNSICLIESSSVIFSFSLHCISFIIDERMRKKMEQGSNSDHRDPN